MEFTGERFIPGSESGALLEAEHMQRYSFAVAYAKGKSVLDIACGAGYGSRMLFDSGAASVVGIDISAEAVEFAQKQYGASKIRFIQADAGNYCTGNYDLVVSFETIEHLDEREKFLSHVYEMLNSNGVLIISTPNRSLNSPMKKPEEIKNQYHVYEYLEKEFLAALQEAGFKSITKYGQHHYPGIFNIQLISRILRRRKCIINGYCNVETAKVSLMKTGTAKYFVFVAAK